MDTPKTKYKMFIKMKIKELLTSSKELHSRIMEFNNKNNIINSNNSINNINPNNNNNNNKVKVINTIESILFFIYSCLL